jgi:hypothetical protein
MKNLQFPTALSALRLETEKTELRLAHTGTENVNGAVADSVTEILNHRGETISRGKLALIIESMRGERSQELFDLIRREKAGTLTPQLARHLAEARNYLALWERFGGENN